MKTVSLLLLSIFVVTAAHAEILHLKNGKSVTGKITERGNKSVKIDSDGIPMTYYADEISDIDGEPFAAPVASQGQVAPVKQRVINDDAGLSGTDSNKRELILKFIDVFGTRAAMGQNLDAMLKSLPADNPDTSKIRDNIKVDEIIDRLIPIYDKQFSADDLKLFIDFYSSPVGRKLVEGIPVIMRESIDVSSQYFQEKFPESTQDNKK